MRVIRIKINCEKKTCYECVYKHLESGPVCLMYDCKLSFNKKHTDVLRCLECLEAEVKEEP